MANINDPSIEEVNELQSGDLLYVGRGSEDKKYDGSKLAQKSEFLNAVVRYPSSGSGWEILNDTTHESSPNITGIVTNPVANYNFQINYNAFSKVGSLVAGVDETYSSLGLKIGASVGLTSALFRVTRDGFNIRAVVYRGNVVFANDTGQIVLSSEFSATIDAVTGDFVISHPDIVCTYGDIAFIAPYTGTSLEYRLVSKTSTSATFRIYNNGVLLTALSSLMKFNFTRTGTFMCNENQIKSSNANFWIMGNMVL